ncbi:MULTISPECIES: TetR/AcrR family transcriptional regulator [unclassified Saccharothrix]|uniref:TetR/AcrR family transcriptional regulator n=1 Tax=unclassified Saccharothrix TaxID=2593673 RepID=UPI00307D6D9A
MPPCPAPQPPKVERKAANVARRSLYEHFGGKDGLIAEVLRRTAEEDLTKYATTMDHAGDDPRTRLLAIFDELDRVVATPTFRGCRYLAADLSLTPDHPAHEVTRTYRARLHALLRKELDRLAHPNPATAADQLHLLVEGVLATGAANPGTHPGRAAKALAETII